MAKEQTIPLGYEVGTGTPIAVPLRHMAVTGQTQQSGKTTTLEALIGRAGITALTFVTKRGEGSFAEGRRVAPYFRDRADWKFVDELLEAVLQEKNKFLRQWIIRICRTTETLADVQVLVREKLLTAKGMDLGAFTQLDAYLEMIVPEIERADLAETLDLAPGLNVMDVSGFTTAMQMLFIQSAIDWINAKCRHTVVVIPEAWEFVPQGKGSPVKKAVETLVRKGGGLGNFIWLDSQDMAGVDKLAMRACTVWLIGVQREINEIKRNIANIPAGIKRPKPDEIALLERGQFVACFDKTTVKVYVQPSWMTMGQACGIAMGKTAIDDAGNQPPPKAAPPARAKPKPAPAKEDEVDHATAKALTEENARLKADIAAAEQRGYERGAEAALRQAGEYWNAAALDMRDNARKVADLGEHLAGIAREGRWSLPRGAAKPASRTGETRPSSSGFPETPSQLKPVTDSADAPADRPAAAPSQVLIDTLVLSYPIGLSAELWGAFAKKSPTSGWFRGQLKILRDGGYFVVDGGTYSPTAHALRSSSLKPENPKDAAALWGIWRDVIAEDVGASELAHLEVLYRHRPHFLTAEQWGLLTTKSTTSGWWRGTMAKLRKWELLETEGARHQASAKGAAVLGDVAKAPVETGHAIQLARHKAMAGGGQQLFDLLKPGDDRKTLIGRAGWNPTSGHARGAIAALLASGLVEDRAGALHPAKEELA